MSDFDYNLLTNNDFEEIFKEANLVVRKPNIPVIAPRRHQLLTLAKTIGEDIRRVPLFHDIGTGKTLTALWLMTLWKVKKVLIVCPSSAFCSWQRDLKKYTNFTYVVLTGEKKDRIEKLSKQYDFYIINYEGLKCIYGELKEKENKREWVINDLFFIDNFDCITFDEVHKCRSYASLQSEIAYQLSRRSKYTIGMTGTPIETSLLDLWNVFKVIDHGKCLGNNFFAFRRTYFYPITYQLKKQKRSFTEWKPTKEAEQQILSRIAPITTSFKREDCLDIPKKQPPIQRILEATPEQKRYFKQICEGLKIEVNEGILTKDNILKSNKTAKLLQITGGFLYVQEDNQRSAHIFEPNPKLDALKDIYEEAQEKIVVFHQFIEEGRILEKWAKKEKIKFSSLRGEIKDKEKQYTLFVEDPTVKFMFGHPECAGESYDMTVASLMVFYSNGSSLRQREQAEGRINRDKQIKRCVFIDLLIKDSVDFTPLQNIETKKSLAQRVYEFIKNY
jgi:SWI/SNF-related matrix-associated actin-dependent regulator 1 of chromatin subfamily A